jgi:hypothetical protein
MGLELTRVMAFTLLDVAGHMAQSCVNLCTLGYLRTRRVVGSLLLFLVARPIVSRLNLGR